MAVRRTSHRFTLQHSIVQNPEASDWLRGVRCEYKWKIKRQHFTVKTLQSKLSLNFNTVMATYMDVSFQSSIKTQHVQHARWELQKLIDAIKTKALSSILLSFTWNAHELKWLCCCFQMRSYMFGKKVWQQFGEAQICSWRISSERHPHLRSSGEGRVFHHPETSFTFTWRLLQIFPWHPASFPGSHRGCSSVVLWRMNITWKTLHTNDS